MKAKVQFKIGKRTIGPGHPCMVIAEIGQAHDGSLGSAHAYIDAVAAAGADAVKFQTHIAAAESSPREKFRVRVFPQDETRYDYWKRMEFTREQWAGLAAHTQDKGLIFLSSPFSFEAVELLEKLGMPAWKIGSGEISNLPLLEMVARTGKPVLLSSGMSPWKELDEAVACMHSKAPFAIFQCTTAYPCPPEKIGLNVVGELRQRYGCPVGLSDHSGTVYPGLAAAALGADLLEVHTVFSRECFGPDVSASVTTTELAQLVEGARFIGRALAHPVRKDKEAAALSELRSLFGKYLAAGRDLVAGQRLTNADIGLRKTGSGIPARRLKEIIGRTVTRNYRASEPLKESDIE